MRVEFATLKRAVSTIFARTGLPQSQCGELADLLVVTQAKGVYSHGVGFINTYLNALRSGYINQSPNIHAVRDMPSAALLDGDNGLGVSVAKHAVELAMDKAAKTGCATVCVCNGNHFGAGLYYAQIATAKNMILYLYANTNPCMAPWGGSKALLGTNPYTFGAPAGKYAPYILDMATTTVAFNKISHALAAGQNVPATWAIDKNGNPCTDPKQVLDGGTMLPFGGIKGYGIAGMVNIVGGVLADAAFGYDIRCHTVSPEQHANIGYMVEVINIASLMDIADYNRRMEEFVGLLKNAPRAPGVDEIYYPGDIEQKKMDKALREGVEISDYSWEMLQKAAHTVGEDLDALIKNN